MKERPYFRLNDNDSKIVQMPGETVLKRELIE